jgi:hypothetical protein
MLSIERHENSMKGWNCQFSSVSRLVIWDNVLAGKDGQL